MERGVTLPLRYKVLRKGQACVRLVVCGLGKWMEGRKGVTGELKEFTYLHESVTELQNANLQL